MIMTTIKIVDCVYSYVTHICLSDIEGGRETETDRQADRFGPASRRTCTELPIILSVDDDGRLEINFAQTHQQQTILMFCTADHLQTSPPASQPVSGVTIQGHQEMGTVQ